MVPNILAPTRATFQISCCSLPQGWWWLVLENCAAGDLYRIVQQTGPIREEGWLVSQVKWDREQTEGVGVGVEVCR